MNILDRDKLGAYLNEVRRMGLRVLPPDVNASRAEFAPVGNDIRFGLTAVKGVGDAAVQALKSDPIRELDRWVRLATPLVQRAVRAARTSIEN